MRRLKNSNLQLEINTANAFSSNCMDSNFKQVLLNYLFSIPQLNEKQVSLLMHSIKKLKMPKYCVVAGIHYYIKCLDNSSNVYVKLCSALYLGYRLFHDHYVSIRYYAMLCKVDKHILIGYENRILRLMNFDMHISTSHVNYVIKSMEMLGTQPTYRPMTPVTPIIDNSNGIVLR